MIHNTRDLLLHADRCRSGVSLDKITKPPYFVKETEMVDELLKEFQQGKFHMAIVIDKEGRTMGLVTLEDLLEEIVESIYDAM